MPALRRFDVDELLTRPGTYFHPETEIVLVVDDSAHVDLELIEDEDEGAEWILLGDDPAIDEHKRDELVEAFETRRARSSAREDPDEDEADEEDELEPDPDDEYVRVRLDEVKDDAEVDVDREQLHALEPRRLAVLGHVRGDDHRQQHAPISSPLNSSDSGNGPITKLSSTSTGITNSAIWALEPIAIAIAMSILSRAAK